MFGPCFLKQYLHAVSLLFLQSSILAEEEKAGCFSCLPAVLWMCMVAWVGLQFVIVVHVFHGQTQFCSFHLYFHFHCESLNEPLHLRFGSYLHKQIDLSHTHIHVI